MRIRLAAVAALVLVAPVLTLSPAEADVLPPNLVFAVSPVAGPSGTQITVTGNCSPNATVNVSLGFPVRSDAILPPIDTATVASDGAGEFSAALTNDIVSTAQFPGEDPVDLEVSVSCNGVFRQQPFASTSRTTTDSPTIFTGLGQGACGQGFGPPGVDLSIPCPVHAKGFTAAGAMQTAGKNTNVYGFYDNGGRGASVAAGFIDGDNLPDVVVGSNPGQAAVGVYWAGGGSSVFTPFGGFTGQVSVAVGDVLGDAAKEIISAAGPGGGPHVVVSSVEGAQLASFFAYGPAFRGGVSVAAADIDGDGKDEIVTGAGPGGGPHVRTFEGNGVAHGDGFYAYAAAFSGGLTIAAGNLDEDSSAEIVTGTQGGGGPHVQAMNADGSKIGPGFYAYDAAFGGGVSVAVGNVNGAAGNEIVTGPYLGGGPHIRVFTSTAGASSDGGFFAYSNIPAGTRVAVVR